MLKWKVFLFSLCVFPSAGGGGGGRAREAAAGRARDALGAGVAGGRGQLSAALGRSRAAERWEPRGSEAGEAGNGARRASRCPGGGDPGLQCRGGGVAEGGGEESRGGRKGSMRGEARDAEGGREGDKGKSIIPASALRTGCRRWAGGAGPFAPVPQGSKGLSALGLAVLPGYKAVFYTPPPAPRGPSPGDLLGSAAVAETGDLLPARWAGREGHREGGTEGGASGS